MCKHAASWRHRYMHIPRQVLDELEQLADGHLCVGTAFRDARCGCRATSPRAGVAACLHVDVELHHLLRPFPQLVLRVIGTCHRRSHHL